MTRHISLPICVCKMKVCQKAREKSFYGLSRTFSPAGEAQLARAKYHASSSGALHSSGAAMTLAAVCPPATTTLSCSHPGCNYTTDRVNNLTRHERTHSGHSENGPRTLGSWGWGNAIVCAEPFVCSHPGCSYRSADSGALRRHQRRHTGEKPVSQLVALGHPDRLSLSRRLLTGAPCVHRPYATTPAAATPARTSRTWLDTSARTRAPGHFNASTQAATTKPPSTAR